MLNGLRSSQAAIMEHVTSCSSSSWHTYSAQLSSFGRVLDSQTQINERLSSKLDVTIANMSQQSINSLEEASIGIFVQESIPIPSQYERRRAQRIRKSQRDRKLQWTHIADWNNNRYYDWDCPALVRLLAYLGVRGRFLLESSTEGKGTTTSTRISVLSPWWLWAINKHVSISMVFEKMNNSWNDIAIHSSRINVRNTIRWYSPVCRAMKQGELEAFRFLIDHGGIGINDVFDGGKSLLQVNTLLVIIHDAVIH